jgi:IS30 family transposase
MKEDDKIKIRALADAHLSSANIANQLGLNRETVKSFIRKYNLTKDLPPKVKVYKGKIQGRKQLEVLNYIKEHPMDTRRDIIDALDLGIAPRTLSDTNTLLGRKQDDLQWYQLRIELRE